MAQEPRHETASQIKLSEFLSIGKSIDPIIKEILDGVDAKFREFAKFILQDKVTKAGAMCGDMIELFQDEIRNAMVKVVVDSLKVDRKHYEYQMEEVFKLILEILKDMLAKIKAIKMPNKEWMDEYKKANLGDNLTSNTQDARIMKQDVGACSYGTITPFVQPSALHNPSMEMDRLCLGQNMGIPWCISPHKNLNSFCVPPNTRPLDAPPPIYLLMGQ
jgi:hypothetical protein